MKNLVSKFNQAKQKNSNFLSFLLVGLVSCGFSVLCFNLPYGLLFGVKFAIASFVLLGLSVGSFVDSNK